MRYKGFNTVIRGFHIEHRQDVIHHNTREADSSVSRVQLHLRHNIRQDLRMFRMSLGGPVWHGKVS